MLPSANVVVRHVLVVAKSMNGAGCTKAQDDVYDLNDGNHRGSRNVRFMSVFYSVYNGLTRFCIELAVHREREARH